MIELRVCPSISDRLHPPRLQARSPLGATSPASAGLARSSPDGGLHVPLRLIQSGAALAEKRDSLGRELKGRARMARGRLHITPGDKPLQIAFLVAGSLRVVVLSHAAEERNLRVRQIFGHSAISGSGPYILADRHKARIAAGRGGIGGGRAFLDEVGKVVTLASG